ASFDCMLAGKPAQSQVPGKSPHGFFEQIVDVNTATMLQQNEREERHSVAVAITGTLMPRRVNATCPRFRRPLFVTTDHQHLAKVPPAIHTSRIFRQVSAQQRDISSDLVSLPPFIADMMESNVRDADVEAVA